MSSDTGDRKNNIETAELLIRQFTKQIRQVFLSYRSVLSRLNTTSTAAESENNLISNILLSSEDLISFSSKKMKSLKNSISSFHGRKDARKYSAKFIENLELFIENRNYSTPQRIQTVSRVALRLNVKNKTHI